MQRDGRRAVDEEGRQSERALACFALRRSDDPDVAADLLDGLADTEPPSEEVDVAHPQADGLAPTQPDRAGEEHESSVPGRHGAGEAQQLFGGQRRSLGLPHPRQAEHARPHR